MEFVLGAAAAGCAVVFTNPLEVVKTRFQLQGELRKRGQYAVHYKNIPSAFYVILKHDGLLALQKGLTPSVIHQFLLNGSRLGLYHMAEDRGLVQNESGEEISFGKAVAAGTVAGCVGGFISSPLYLVKIHLQSKANLSIAVGHQHETGEMGIMKALRRIYKEHGVIRGLWRGTFGSIVRYGVGSSAQYTTFTACKEYFIRHELLSPDQKILNAFASGMIGGLVTSLIMSPFDLISIRLYNQGLDSSGKGLLYKSYADCVKKTFQTEGIYGLYKGVWPCYLRLGPHTALSFMFWDLFRGIYDENWKTVGK